MKQQNPSFTSAFSQKLAHSNQTSLSTEFKNNHYAHAQHATISRLVSCLINEQLVSAYICFSNSDRKTQVTTTPTSKYTPNQKDPTDKISPCNDNEEQINMPIYTKKALNNAFLMITKRNEGSDDTTSGNSNSSGNEPGETSVKENGFRNTKIGKKLVNSLDVVSGSAFVFQLLNIPILENEITDYIYSVGFVDPEEFGPFCWYIENTSNIDTKDIGGEKMSDPIFIMRMVGEWLGSNINIVNDLCKELLSSVENQSYRYTNPPTLPDIKKWNAIDWENCIVEGHATHPMHKARYAVAPEIKFGVDIDFSNINLKFIKIQKSKLVVENDFEYYINHMLKSYFKTIENTNKNTPEINKLIQDIEVSSKISNPFVIIPVHPLQLPAVKEIFKSDIEILPIEIPANGQASLRTISVDYLHNIGKCIKLPIAIKVSSALRTVTPWSTYIGPRVTELIPIITQKLNEIESESNGKVATKVSGIDSFGDYEVNGKTNDGIDNTVLYIAKEPASAVYKTDDFDVAKYLACIIRDEAESLIDTSKEKVIICAALTERDVDGISFVEKCWKLQSKSQRIEFLFDYVDKLFAAFLPYIINFGWAFESHQQNTLVRVTKEEPHKVTGFVVRDFGGIKVYRPQLKSVLGDHNDLKMLPDSCTDAHTMDEVYKLAYHTLIQCQLHRLVRALRLHYCGSGWAVVREVLNKHVPENHPLLKSWLSPKIDMKCFVSMKLDSLYRDYIYHKVPNILLYNPSE
ncbi:hypothetical protein BB559_000543 [Furculomyces boomerangus]|uniref:Aerobactin siderophore biosynthesis IucA/IucC N-terminal domain-containing protein n=1 Tax=Furculomyces boomerangus TaxID=61424 RepID=A0A2T9Z4V7_9FUNG|nr:hypothetical protein BB559_000543 [Furculomyces boomerangus]